jgi:hypothetical protein
MIIHEHSWNAYPYSKTELTNPGMKKDNFYIRIETIHLNKDRGNTENVCSSTFNPQNTQSYLIPGTSLVRGIAERA